MPSIDKIICFGKNYASHMHELGDAPAEKPVIFLKPASVLQQCHSWYSSLELHLPQDELHYECELVVQLKSGGYQLTPENAAKSIGNYTIGLDMTLRRVQADLKKAGHPWTIGKVFPGAAIVGPWLPVTAETNLTDLDFYFKQNNEVKQEANTSSMLMSCVDLIMHASQCFPLCANDILFTGTPSGVGPVIKNVMHEVGIGADKYFVKWN